MFGWKTIKKKIKKAAPKRQTIYTQNKEAARALINSRLEYFNQEQKYTFNKVAIRDQKRCWGSCSSKRNLNFNYKLLFLPECLRDYVILHELSHLDIMNHSAAFWAELESVCPDSLAYAAELRRIERTLGTSAKALKQYTVVHECKYCAANTVLP